MRAFTYYTITPEGKIIQKSTYGESYRALANALKKNQIYYFNLREKKITSYSFSSLKVKTEVMLFFKRLALLLEACIPIDDALLLIQQESAYSKTLGNVIAEIAAKVQEGIAFSQAISAHPQFFNALVCAITLSGDKSGNLAHALDETALLLENQITLFNELTQALLYPFILLVTSCIVITILLVYVAPEIILQLEGNDIPLPLSSRIVLLISNNLKYVFFALLAAAGLAKLTNLYTKKDLVTLYFYKTILKIEWVAKHLKLIQSNHFLMTLHLLLSTSIPIFEAFKIAKNSMTNELLKTPFSHLEKGLEAGDTVSTTLQKTGLFSPICLNLISIGEKTGSLQKMINYIMLFQKKEIQSFQKTLIKFIEPALILLLCIIVLFIFLATLQPMLSLNKTIGL